MKKQCRVMMGLQRGGAVGGVSRGAEEAFEPVPEAINSGCLERGLSGKDHLLLFQKA